MRHVKPASRSRGIPVQARGFAPPTDLLGKIAQALGIKQF